MPNRGSLASYRAKTDTVDQQESKLGVGKDAWIFFHDADSGKKVLVIHGNEYGVWGVESEEALHKHPDTDVIWCCHPLLMKQNTRDMRIQGRFRGKLAYSITYGSRYAYIAIVVNDERDND